MSRRELDRAAVMARVKSGSISLTEATPLLGISYRQAKRLYSRYKTRGASGLMHASAGRASNRSHPLAEREMVISLVRDRYSGAKSKGVLQRFGPTLTAEHLWSDHGVLVPVNTLARWMKDDGLWSRARRRKSSQHQRRERRDHFGEMVQLDGSFHDWFEGRGGVDKGCLMTMVDDATSRTLLSMGKEETTWAAANVLKAWMSEYGVPRALYTDWKNVYKRVPTSSELKRGETEVFTQFGRMCEKLGIEVIAASSPQAKGRVERAHGTHQDRLVKKLRLKGIASYEAANEYFVNDYTRAHNARFAVSPASSVDYHARRDRRALADDDVLCLESTRTVGNDHVVQYGVRNLQLDRVVRGRVPAKSTVLVRETEDGRLRVIHVTGEGRDRSERELKWSDAVPRAVRTRASPEISTSSTESAAGRKPNKPPHPASDHPWRKQHQIWIELARLRRAAADAHP
ncbi:MAG: ISNCY family transposase [Gemmatimonadota bacterium]|nr:ISNCY family transposase [Gemmatimonadota bacterium]